MRKCFGKLKINVLFCLLVLSGCFSWAEAKEAQNELFNGKKTVWDSSKYISVAEIKPGMQAYCRTIYKGTQIEEFELEVMDVIHNFRLGRSDILVQGLDERFIHTGPVAGCSGSPVYIDGRLAGALARGWTFSKDAFYIVTPIKDMLDVGTLKTADDGRGETGYLFDFSQPIDFSEIDKQLLAGLGRRKSMTSAGGATALPCPLVISGLPASVCERLNEMVENFGFMAVSGVVGSGGVDENENVELVPGATLAVPLITGDISAAVIGTVTEVVGDDVYGFGHDFLGYGPIDLPMATGKVHAVVSNVYRSFKLGSPIEIVGALIDDESSAVHGRIGAVAKMIPLTIKIDRYNDIKKRSYDCQIAVNRQLTPMLLRLAMTGTTLMLGGLPPNHVIEYKVNIAVAGNDSIVFENVSTGFELNEVIKETCGTVALLMNNPYRKVDITSIDFAIRVVQKNIASHIWSAQLSDLKTKAGEQIDIEMIIESVLQGKKKYAFSLKIPAELKPGKYKLILCGGYDYKRFLVKNAPYKFTFENLPTLITAINDILAVKRNRLYCLLVLPASGIVLGKAELPDLPATKTLILQSPKRTLAIQPYRHWIEKSIEIDSIVIDKKIMSIIVEK